MKNTKVSGWLKKGSTLGEKFEIKDPEKEKYVKLCEEHDEVNEEYKKLKSYIDILESDYYASKQLDFVRRYLSLKGMMKRTVLHMRLPNIAAANASETNTKDTSTSAPTQGIGALGGGLVTMSRTFAKKAEQAKQREERFKNMTTEEIKTANIKMDESIKEYRRKCEIITNAIENLDKEYIASKIYFPLRRYAALKQIVKRTINDRLIRDA